MLIVQMNEAAPPFRIGEANSRGERGRRGSSPRFVDVFGQGLGAVPSALLSGQRSAPESVLRASGGGRSVQVLVRAQQGAHLVEAARQRRLVGRGGSALARVERGIRAPPVLLDGREPVEQRTSYSLLRVARADEGGLEEYRAFWGAWQHAAVWDRLVQVDRVRPRQGGRPTDVDLGHIDDAPGGGMADGKTVIELVVGHVDTGS